MTLDSDSQKTRWRRFTVPSLADLIYVALFSWALVLGGGLTNRDGDLGRHLLLGRSILDNGSIPQIDIYSFTVSGTEIIPHWWLSQTVFAAVERWFGFDGIGLLTASLCALPWFVLYRWCVKRGTPINVAAILSLLGGLASVIHWAARPHIFTWLFVVVWVLLLEDLRTGKRTQVWMLIPLSVLWANIHAGFTIGILIAGTYLLGSIIDSLRHVAGQPGLRRTQHLTWITIGVAAGSLLTPGGMSTIINAFSYLGQDFLIDTTIEYQSPDFHNPTTWPFLIMVLTTISLRQRWNPTHLLLALSWTASAFFSMRNIPIFAIVMTPILAISLTRFAETLTLPLRPRLKARLADYASIEKRLVGGFMAVALTLLSALVLARSPGSDFDFDPALFPIGAMEEFGDDPPGERPFHMFTWGGYLEYCCHPEVLVFIDGQTDIYGEGLSEEYLDAVNGRPRWHEVFTKHRVDWVIIEPETGLAQVLAETEVWSEKYRDETAVVYVPANTGR